MDVEDDHTPEELESREPSVEDLLNLCRTLNELGARYVVVGGFAIRAAGYERRTMDVDLIVATDSENEALVYRALETLPDKAVLELLPGEIEQHTVVRVADEIVIDLMKSACGIGYAEASKDVVIHEVEGVKIPFASPRLLWRMKAPTRREKDIPDLIFLRQYFASRGELPPE
jgi:hypothetical protein